NLGSFLIPRAGPPATINPVRPVYRTDARPRPQSSPAPALAIAAGIRAVARAGPKSSPVAAHPRHHTEGTAVKSTHAVSEPQTADRGPDNWALALFDGIDDAVFVHDLEGHILEANAAACQRLGYTREEMLHLTTSDIDAPEFAEGFGERLQQQLAAGGFR